MTSASPKLDVSSAPAVPLLDAEQYLSRLRGKMAAMQPLRAMYNSVVGGIVTDPELMTVPLFDHAIVRGHAVFDTCNVAGGKLVRLDTHLDRLLSGAARARIPLPFGEDPGENKERMRQLVAKTVLAAGLRDAEVRYYLSAGPGNFAVTPAGCTPGFYIVVLARGALGATGPAARNELGVLKEYTVQVPMKPPLLATVKNTNYLLNVLVSMESQDRGGKWGIWVEPDGHLAESCVMNVFCLLQDGRLVTPPFDHILNGVTARYILGLGPKLLEEGLVSAVSQEPVQLSAAKESAELFLCGGDCHIFAVTHLDDAPIGLAQPGPTTKRIFELLVAQPLSEDCGDCYELVGLP